MYVILVKGDTCNQGHIFAENAASLVKVIASHEE